VTPIWGVLGLWRAAATEAGWSRGSLEPASPNPARLLPTVPTNPLVFAPEMLALALLPGPRSSHRPLSTQASAEPHSSHPALARQPRFGHHLHIHSPRPATGSPGRSFPDSREQGGFKQPQPRIHDFPQRRITDTCGASPSARCIGIKSGHETVTILRDPQEHIRDPARLCASCSRKKAEKPALGDELQLGKAQSCTPAWLGVHRTLYPGENRPWDGQHPSSSTSRSPRGHLLPRIGPRGAPLGTGMGE